MAGRIGLPRRTRAEATRRYALAWQLAGVGTTYYVAARLSLLLSLVGRSVTPFWPPTGIAVVALLAFGYRVWPAIAVGAFLVNLPISPSAVVALTIAIGNTAAPVLVVRLLRELDFRRSLARLRDALAILVCALAGTLVSASVGSASLLASGTIKSAAFLETWSVWWTGDAMGVLIVAPLLLSLWSAHAPRITLSRSAEAIGLFAALGAGTFLLLTSVEPVWVLLFPLIALIAWRFQLPGAAPAAFVVSTVATWAAVADLGPFAHADLLARMLGLQTFNAAASFTSLFLATVVSERLRAHEALERAAISLEHTVERRTAIASTLQHSMLPERLPDISDVDLAARYLPATTDADVGGDWYDAVPLGDGRLAIAIGDVAGHGIPAAATMGQLRMALRAYTLDGHSPAVAMEHINALIREVQPGKMATLLCMHLDPRSGEFRFANAGHPPPLIISTVGPDGYLEGGLGPPVGTAQHGGYIERTGLLPHGATLYLYTDGLVERRSVSIDDGLARLERAARSAPGDLEEACDHIVRSAAPGGSEDDIALLAIRRVQFANSHLDLRKPAAPASVPEIRRLVEQWLTENGATASDAFDIVVACAEACTNVIQHAYGPGGGTVALAATILDGLVLISVKDEGEWRPRDGISDDTSGRGFRVMNAMMDGVSVDSTQTGTEIRMRRVLRRA